MKIKLYYAKSIDGKKTIQFRDKTLIVNDPFLFEYIASMSNEKNKDVQIDGEKATIDMKEYQIFEIEIEGTVNEKK